MKNKIIIIIVKTISFIKFDLSEIETNKRYKLLIGIVVPRPIAFITTINPQNITNAAPFSYFNLMGNDPPIVSLGIGKDKSRKNKLKDTAYNIQQTGEFVINIVNEDLIKDMNITSADFPSGLDETKETGLTQVPSSKVKPPRIAESPANLECRHISSIEIRNTRITLGEVIYLHVKNEFVDEKGFILTDLIRPIGRMHQGGFYTRTNDLFNLPRPTYQELLKKNKNHNDTK